MSETLSRVVAYSKLGSNECEDEENGIECGVISSRDDTGHFSIDDASSDDDEIDEYETQQLESASGKKGGHHGLEDAVISHLQGRPDFETIIKTAFESARDEETDIAVFMCGPSQLTAAVSRAINKEEENSGRCFASALTYEPREYVYQEMFEL